MDSSPLPLYYIILCMSKIEPQKGSCQGPAATSKRPSLRPIVEPKTDSDAGPCDEPFVVKTQQNTYAKARNEINIISL